MTPPPFLGLVFTLAGKDWRLFWSDRRAAFLTFAVPIALASAFGLIFAKPTDARATPRLPLAIVIEDDGPFAKRVAEELLASGRCEATILTRSEAEARIADRRPSVALVLPHGFERLIEWRPTAIQVLHHPLANAERQIAEGIAMEIVMRALAKARFGAAVEPPLRTEAAAVGGPNAAFHSYSHSFSGMTLQYLLFWGMESGLLLLRERQRGPWQRLRTAPVPLAALLAGKALATAAIAMLVVAFTFAFGHFAFGVRIQSWAGFGLLALAASALAAAAGLLVAAIGGSEARARSLSILAILGVSMLGGLWLPAFLLPNWLRDISLALPTTWAMRGLDAATWQGLGLATILRSTGIVAAFALAFLTLAAWRLSVCESNRKRGLA